jgi:uncharacterized repeat protein (TIGR03803 family)
VTASDMVAGLTLAPDGLLWGVSQRGAPGNFGTIFTLNSVTNVVTPVLSFTGDSGAFPGGAPQAELTYDGAGYMWGVTAEGGAMDRGVVFKINVMSKDFTVITEFNGINGLAPGGGLVADNAGFLWGVTAEGGEAFRGTVFRLNPSTNELATVVHFTGTDGDFLGDGPLAGLTKDSSGFMWGTTYEGGETNQGTIFKIDSTTLDFTSVLAFSGNSGSYKGAGPAAALVPDSSGTFLWGTTEAGGADNVGMVFRVRRSTSVYSPVVEFNGPQGTKKGANPRSALIQDGLGSWYGTTEAGGTGFGTVFKITSTNLFSSLFEFTGSAGNVPGEKPRGSLVMANDGNIYGTTMTGGSLSLLNPAGNGQIFRLRFGPTTSTLPPTVAATTATLNGTVNPNGTASTVTFRYGTSPTLAGATTVSAGTTGTGTTAQAVSAGINGLQWATVYYYRVQAVNAENATPQQGEVLSFSTPVQPGGGFAAWLTAAGGAGGATAAGSDPDKDGTSNAIEYVLGSNPLLADFPAQPAATFTPSQIIFTFLRADASESPDLTLTVETGETLQSWPSGYLIGPNTASSSPGVSVVENGTSPDLITVTIPKFSSLLKFARLKAVVTP